VRFDQVGKTLSQEKLEELRALPFYVPWTDEARRVDLLDWYFPDDASVTVITPNTTGSYDAAANEWDFTTTETPLVVEGKDFLRATTVQFVSVQDNGSIQAVQPEAGYQSHEPTPATPDTPATQSVKVTVSVSWTSQGQARSVSLDTIIHNIRQGVPNVEASGSVLAAQVSGVEFHEGGAPGEGITAEILASIGEASTSFREVTGSESDASADPIDVLERELVTGALVQPEQPADPNSGATASSVPNTVSGNVASALVGLSAGTVSSEPPGVGAIAGWRSSNPSAATRAEVSTLHPVGPEGQAAVTVNAFQVNAHPRDDAAQPPLMVFQLGSVAGLVEEQSTTTQVEVDSSMSLSTIPATETASAVPAATVWATRAFASNPDFRGIVTIDSMEVDVTARASATTASTSVDWRVNGLRVWDPEQLPTELGDDFGGYNGPFTFGFDSTCGGWEDNPLTPILVESPATGFCGLTRFDQTLQPTDNPRPGQIPCAYFQPGNCAPGAPSSLSIVAGVTVREPPQIDAAAGSAAASVAQKNILSITTQDVPKALVQLEPMLVGLGDASADASYITHEH
jgi:hypothetical protein